MLIFSDQVELIVSYHPPIFVPLRRLTQSSWKERLVLRCAERRVALYSPHTAWDALRGGVNDWLLKPFRESQAAPVCESVSSARGDQFKTFRRVQCQFMIVSTPLFVSCAFAFHGQCQNQQHSALGSSKAPTTVQIELSKTTRRIRCGISSPSRL